uniref:Putative RNA-binding protein 15B n=1 Tax=Tetranychus truncatus TaxID=93132 RepID=A0A3G5ANY2_9ACAR|nr:putative RNA-binding protein 15B [Tetranychus truncatus]
MPRYDDSPRDRSPIESRRDRNRVKSPSDRRRGRDSPVNVSLRSGSVRDPYDDYPTSRVKSERESAAYKILCISNLNAKVGDTTVKEALSREFSRFGDVSVKVCHDDNDRFAYIYFRSYEEAREARHNKPRLHLFDKAVEIEPIYDHRSSMLTSSSSSSGRRRSVSPAYTSSRSARGPPASPPPSSRRPPPPPPPLPLQSRNNVEKSSSNSGNSNQQYSRPAHRPSTSSSSDYHHQTRPSGTTNRQTHRESKKEKFPNYLHHIPPEDDDKATRTLFVGNLEVTISEADLRRIFERYGVVEDIDVKRPPPGQGNAYAFIKFLNLDMAHRAKVEMSGQYIGKFQCKIGYGKATPTPRIWVGGLGPWTSLTHLEREFDRFGSIRKIDFTKGNNYAYLQFDSIDAATAACQEMRGHALGGPDKRLRVDFADPSPYSRDPSSDYNSPPRQVTTTSSASRYHGSDYGDNYNEKSSSRTRPANVSGDSYSGNDNEDNKRERSGYPSGSGSGNNSNWNYWEEASRSPNDRRRARPRTPETGSGDVSERKKSRRTSLSPDGGLGGDRTPGSPRRSSRTSAGQESAGKHSPNFERNKSEERNRAPAPLENIKVFSDFTKFCPSAWNGGLILKNSAFPAKMYLCSGDISLVDILMQDPSSEMPMLKITQRLRFDPLKLEDVSRRMNSAGASGHCMLFATAGSSNAQLQAGLGEDGRAVQTRPLKNLVTYLKQKEAAGVISLTNTVKEVIGVLYAFPPCSFALDLLRKVAPNLSAESPKEEYLVVVVVRGST